MPLVDSVGIDDDPLLLVEVVLVLLVAVGRGGGRDGVNPPRACNDINRSRPLVSTLEKRR